MSATQVFNSHILVILPKWNYKIVFIFTVGFPPVDLEVMLGYCFSTSLWMEKSRYKHRSNNLRRMQCFMSCPGWYNPYFWSWGNTYTQTQPFVVGFYFIKLIFTWWICFLLLNHTTVRSKLLTVISLQVHLLMTKPKFLLVKAICWDALCS